MSIRYLHSESTGQYYLSIDNTDEISLNSRHNVVPSARRRADLSFDHQRTVVRAFPSARRLAELPHLHASVQL